MDSGRMVRDLRLTPEQEARVAEIMAERLAELARLGEHSRDQVREEFRLMKREVADVLHADQATICNEQSDRYKRLERELRRQGEDDRRPSQAGSACGRQGSSQGHVVRRPRPRREAMAPSAGLRCAQPSAQGCVGLQYHIRTGSVSGGRPTDQIHYHWRNEYVRPQHIPDTQVR